MKTRDQIYIQSLTYVRGNIDNASIDYIWDSYKIQLIDQGDSFTASFEIKQLSKTVCFDPLSCLNVTDSVHFAGEKT